MISLGGKRSLQLTTWKVSAQGRIGHHGFQACGEAGGLFRDRRFLIMHVPRGKF